MVTAATTAVAMARSHQVDQVRQAAAVQAALAAIWDETLDPNDITKSFLAFREKAAPVIGTGRTLAERKATTYYRNLLAWKGLDTADLTDFSKTPYPVAAIKASLSGATGKHLNKAYFLNAKGLPNTAVLALAKADMLGSAKRQILNASRDHLLALSKAHNKIKGWARVSDGNPCGFCAMLVGRGPVYSEDTASFDAHDRCGCSVRLVLSDEEDGGWTEDARAYRWAYENGLQDIRQLSAEQLAAVNAARRAAGQRQKTSALMSARWINGYTSDDILKLYADEMAARAVKEAEAIARAAAAAERAAREAAEAAAKRAAEEAAAAAAKAAEEAAEKLRKKWLGKPAPKAPVLPSAPTPVGPAAFDAWTQKAKDKFAAFAAKTGNPKNDLTKSNNWSYFQRVIEHHDLSALDYLKANHYVDDALYAEALEAIARAKSVPDDARAAFEKDTRLFARRKRTYERNLADWKAVNGITSSQKGMDGGLRHVTDADGVAWANQSASRAPAGEGRDAARLYSGGSYREWNGNLRHGKGTPSGDWIENTKHLDAAMQPTPEDVIVRRGSGLDAFADALGIRHGSIPPHDPKKLVGSIQMDYGYMSTSVGQKAAFGGELALEIKVPAGYPSIWLSPDSRYPGERELLLARGTRLFIHSMERKGGVWHVQAEVIPADDDGQGWVPMPRTD
ncbi:ADP-ribosyltransferase domain and MuF-like fusion protein [Microbacterium phage Percival]|uniref:ADP-ribosyltransferase domain and MuF-like fusion protein n=1 Tax=Microbacterium phage Percival TaxID=2201439 RepID=A0A2Z4Q6J5_9CAUD|nr:ADP-ribosyltransferase domain and MuF-like fusion protein [Microbacterium phage Percival]